jgi:hypothetical protein
MAKKIKFKSAAEKRAYEENQRSWEQLKAKYEKSKPKTTARKTDAVLDYSLSNPPGRERVDVPSRSTAGGNTSARPAMMYSGDAMVGISIIHKSCLQPIFNEQAAKDAAGMRR